MQIVAALCGIILIGAVLVDAFETIIQPRRVTRRVRLTRVFFLSTWRVWSWVARALPGGADREGTGQRDRFLAIYGPLALLLLLALWATALVVGFGLIQWGDGSKLASGNGRAGFGTDVYMSGTTFFTLGLGDVTPRSAVARLVTVAEGATGFSFLALIIGYLPLLYGTFSDREVDITLLDARAGSPPSATELLRRMGRTDDGADLDRFLNEWERWSAVLLESHLSYPVMSFFRSQHERQSWLAALTMILDACSLVVVGVGNDAGGFPQRQARLTFAMARHAIGDLSQILNTSPRPPRPDRLPPEEMARLREFLFAAGIPLREGDDADDQLTALRRLYEPYVTALADSLLLALPPWLPAADAEDDWETTAWQYDRREVRAAMGDLDGTLDVEEDPAPA